MTWLNQGKKGRLAETLTIKIIRQEEQWAGTLCSSYLHSFGTWKDTTLQTKATEAESYDMKIKFVTYMTKIQHTEVRIPFYETKKLEFQLIIESLKLFLYAIPVTSPFAPSSDPVMAAVRV